MESSVRMGRRRSLWRGWSASLVWGHVFPCEWERLSSCDWIVSIVFFFFLPLTFIIVAVNFNYLKEASFLIIGLWCCVFSVIFPYLPCREVYAVSIVGPFPLAVTNLMDLTRLYVFAIPVSYIFFELYFIIIFCITIILKAVSSAGIFITTNLQAQFHPKLDGWSISRFCNLLHLLICVQ